MTTHAVVVQNLSKHVAQRPILQNINLEVPTDAAVGITGHNGSGKSTLLKVITGLVRPSQGQVSVLGRVLGRDVEFAPDTGALVDIPQFLPRYSGFRNLELLAMIRGVIGRKDIEDALTSVGLDPHDKRPFRVYSTGMRQRLGIAQAIMEHPKLLLLDEPTRGVDVGGHEQIYDIIRTLKRAGVTIILASHFATELQDLCDSIYTMNNGQLSSAASHDAAV